MSVREDKNKQLAKSAEPGNTKVSDPRDEHIATLKRHNELLLFNFGKLVDLNNHLIENNQRLTDMLLDLMKKSLNLPS
jgi:hypothetical protein